MAVLTYLVTFDNPKDGDYGSVADGTPSAVEKSIKEKDPAATVTVSFGGPATTFTVTSGLPTLRLLAAISGGLSAEGNAAVAVTTNKALDLSKTAFNTRSWVKIPDEIWKETP